MDGINTLTDQQQPPREPEAPELESLNPSGEPPETPPEAAPATPELSVPPEAPEEPPPGGRGGCCGCLAALLLLALIGAGAAGFGYWKLQQWGGKPYGPPAEHSLQIKPRTSTREIARTLKREGLISDDRIFIAWLKLQPQRHPIQAGDYRIKTPIAPRDLVEALRRGIFQRALTIPEGWTAGQIAARLARDQWIKEPREWLDAVARPRAAELAGVALPQGAEGYIFPDTYRFDPKTSAEEILKRMLGRFKYEWERLEPGRRDPRAAQMTPAQLVTLASLIEREARSTQEMPQIASVYYNRLKKGMKLECDATVRFALGGVWDRPLRYADLKINSPYNTYQNPGLPPGPIANPGRDALAAALRPAPGDDLFYVYGGGNHHVFSRTYNEHLKAVKEARTRNPQSFIREKSDEKKTKGEEDERDEKSGNKSDEKSAEKSEK